MLIVGNYVPDHANDKRELTPNLEQIKNSGFTVETVLADTGYYSDDAVQAAEKSGVNALVAVAKSNHGLALEDILTEKKDQIPPANATPQQIMAIKLKNKKGSEIYRLQWRRDALFFAMNTCRRKETRSFHRGRAWIPPHRGAVHSKKRPFGGVKSKATTFSQR